MPHASIVDTLAGAVRLIAFYLPQFHPIPENDAWWGPGFTEWSNVVKGRPLFRGHDQPRLPADLGFYDLRLPETRQAQASLAREYGLHGFCYYHYWFNGRRLLQRPFEEVLASGSPDLPFCLCWANENWTRAWDGRDRDVLIAQQYSAADDRAHIQSLAAALRDPRYIRIDDKPLLLVYRASQLPNAAATAALWRDEALRLGVGEIFLATVQAFVEDRMDPAHVGFDAAVEFQPDWLNLGRPRRRNWRTGTVTYDYAAVVSRMRQKTVPSYRLFRCVAPGWDNSPRRRRQALVLSDSTPARYGEWLEHAIATSTPTAAGDRVVFVNAWNEWAEGAHLEPCERFGRAYLEETRRVLAAAGTSGD
jgi:lipopolysaccharide biosynthesis protein